MDKTTLLDLVKELDPEEQLEEGVEETLLAMADDFIESVITKSCKLARHRKSDTLEAADVQFALEKDWNIWIPGFGPEGVIGTQANLSGAGKAKKCWSTEAHKQRMALIKKQIKKF